jgi:hypothetical protein
MDPPVTKEQHQRITNAAINALTHIIEAHYEEKYTMTAHLIGIVRNESPLSTSQKCDTIRAILTKFYTLQ